MTKYEKILKILNESKITNFSVFSNYLMNNYPDYWRYFFKNHYKFLEFFPEFTEEDIEEAFVSCGKSEELCEYYLRRKVK